MKALTFPSKCTDCEQEVRSAAEAMSHTRLPKAPRWEHTRCICGTGGVDFELIAHGNIGWELVSVVRVPDTDPCYAWHLFFKRQVVRKR